MNDTNLLKFIITSNVSINILNNVEFAIYSEKLCGNAYQLPIPAYLTTTVLPYLFLQGTRKAVIDIMKKNHY